MPATIVFDAASEALDKVIEDGIARVLSSYSTDDIQIERDWLKREVRQSSDSILRRTSSEQQEILNCTDAIIRLRRRRNVLRNPQFIIVTVFSLAFLTLGLYRLFLWKGPATGTVVLAVISAVPLTVGIALGIVRRLWDRDAINDRLAELEKMTARFDEALRVQVQQVIRTIISERATQEQSSGVLLYETDSSGLVETTALQPVASGNITELERFVREHTTSAIGIAGPRGCGKTTAINHLVTLEGFLGVYIPAPVYYEAADFTRMAHAEVAKVVLRHEGVDEFTFDRRTAISGTMQRLMIGLAWIGVGGLTLTLDGLGVFSWVRESTLRVAGFAMAGSGVVICAIAYVRLVSSILRPRGRGSGNHTEAATLAFDELRRLRWKTSLQTREKHSFKLFSMLTTDSEDQIGLDAYDRSHPERVADLHDFLLKLRNLKEMPRILIAIDELDKMASPEKAIEAVNGLKDLFHITDTHFVVSVSEDALDSFALRGVPARDVFDSSFDTVIRIQPFATTDSWSLIGSRASRFNEWAVLLCHVVAGGLPRDLIRAARRCVALCVAHGSPRPVAELAVQLVKDEAMDVIEAAIRRARSEDTPNRWLMTTRRTIAETDNLADISPDLLFTGRRVPLQAGNGNPRSTIPEAREAAGTPSAWIEANAGVLLLIMITVAELFGEKRSSAGWRAFAEQSRDQLENLAAARASLAISHVDALDRLCGVRQAVGLEALSPQLVNELSAVEVVKRPTAPDVPSDAPKRAAAG